MTKRTIIHPTITLNGSSAKTLMKDYQEARQAIGAAIQKLNRTVPHGRDYPNHPDHLMMARREWAERMARLSEIDADLESLMLGLVEHVV